MNWNEMKFNLLLSYVYEESGSNNLPSQLQKETILDMRFFTVRHYAVMVRNRILPVFCLFLKRAEQS